MIKVITDYTMKVMAGHPAQEARDAKELCDKLADGKVDDYEIKVVSPDAASIYEYYGKNVLGLDIHYFVGDSEVSFQKMYATFNEAFDIVEQYGRDPDEEERQKVVDIYIYDLNSEKIYPQVCHELGAYTLPSGKFLHRCRAKLCTLEPIADCNGYRKGFTLRWYIVLDEQNPIFKDGVVKSTVLPVVIYPFKDGTWRTTFSRHRYEASANMNRIGVSALASTDYIPIAEPECGWDAMCVDEIKQEDVIDGINS